MPSHAWNRWRYHYPQAAFPYDQLRRRTRAGTGAAPEYEILDTGIFDQDRYWVTEVTYAKSDDAAELLVEITVTNAGAGRRHDPRAADRVVPQHLVLGRLRAKPR